MAKANEMTFELLGNNVRGGLDPATGEVVLRIRADQAALQAATPSSTGKTRVVGSTGGFKAIGNVAISLNVTTKAGVPVQTPQSA